LFHQFAEIKGDSASTQTDGRMCCSVPVQPQPTASRSKVRETQSFSAQFKCLRFQFQSACRCLLLTSFTGNRANWASGLTALVSFTERRRGIVMYYCTRPNVSYSLRPIHPHHCQTREFDSDPLRLTKHDAENFPAKLTTWRSLTLMS